MNIQMLGTHGYPIFRPAGGTPASMAPRLEVFPPCFDAHDFVWDPALRGVMGLVLVQLCVLT